MKNKEQVKLTFMRDFKQTYHMIELMRLPQEFPRLYNPELFFEHLYADEKRFYLGDYNLGVRIKKQMPYSFEIAFEDILDVSKTEYKDVLNLTDTLFADEPMYWREVVSISSQKIVFELFKCYVGLEDNGFYEERVRVPLSVTFNKSDKLSFEIRGCLGLDDFFDEIKKQTTNNVIPYIPFEVTDWNFEEIEDMEWDNHSKLFVSKLFKQEFEDSDSRWIFFKLIKGLEEFISVSHANTKKD